MHVFGLWEETCEPLWKRHREKSQKGSSQMLNSNPFQAFYCEMSVIERLNPTFVAMWNYFNLISVNWTYFSYIVSLFVCILIFFISVFADYQLLYLLLKTATTLLQQLDEKSLNLVHLTLNTSCITMLAKEHESLIHLLFTLSWYRYTNHHTAIYL